MMDEGMGGICQLPPGFRLDQEIIVCYLKNKIAATATTVTSIIADVDIYKFDPWELPEKAVVCGEGEWFFFSPRQRKYPNGCRPNRSAGSGYWKATGTDKPILAGGGSRCIGVKKALVFYQGRSPKGTKTEWVMHEYRLLDADDHIVMRRKDSANSMRLDDWVLCRSRNKGSFVVGLPDDMAPADQSRSSPARTRAEHVEDWIDDQLLQCLINSNEPELDHSMINRKRKNNHLSFQAMPNYSYKRANNGMLNSTAPFRETSFSVSETDELFYHYKYLISTP